MKRLCGALLALNILLAAPASEGRQQSPAGGGAAAAAERRVALVIGNGAYAAGPLKNPVNDARAIAQAVAGLGFEVMQRENLSQNEMKRAIRAFGEKLRAGAVGLFYYAGHGVQVKGENYLIPVGATIGGEAEIEYEAVSLGFVLAQMEDARNRMNIVILDACRDNPFARSTRSGSRGLALVEAPGEMLVAYATGPGAVADDGEGANGVYTQEFLKHVRTPGLSVEEVFKRVRLGVLKATQGRQKPWETSSLVSDFQFAAARLEPPALTPSTQQQQPAGAAANAPKKKRIIKSGLVKALQINGLTTAELVEQIELRGVDFQLTPEVERELREAGARPEVINAVRANYRRP